MKRIFVFIGALVYSNILFSQPETESSTVRIMERSAAAPNTANLGKYIDVPVNMATGIPDISIPIYTIKTGNITVPIVLKYHGGGIKVNTPYSWVGLGWDLICGGVVTKQINGQDDFYASSHTAGPPHNNPDHTYFAPYLGADGDGSLGFGNWTDFIDSMYSPFGTLHLNAMYRMAGRIIKNIYDGESDQYSYSTPDGGGTIFFNQKTGSFQDDKLNGWSVYFDYNNPLDDWQIKNATGLTYNFDAKEVCMSSISSINGAPQYYYPSAWHLGSIEDVVTGKEVNFTYDVLDTSTYTVAYSMYEDWEPSYPGSSYSGGAMSSSTRTGTQLYLNAINFPEGRVEFIRDSDGLKYIKIYDKNDVLKKQFTFSYYYAWGPNPNTKRLILQSIQEVDAITQSTAESKPYQFYYDTTIAMPAGLSYAVDIWGYNNGKTSNTTLLPTEWETLALGLPAFANRKVDTNYTKAGIITRIVYPTGGSLNFQFENNRDDADSLVGGLRIKRIINYDSVSGKKLETEYRYNDEQGHSTGTLQYRPKFNYPFGKGATLEATIKVNAQSIYPLFARQGSPVAYSRVEKIDIGDNTETKSVHYFSNNFVDQLDGSGLESYTNQMWVPFRKYPDISGYSNVPYLTKLYKKKNGQFVLIKSDSLAYTTLQHFKNYIWNVQAAWTTSDAFVEWTGNDPYSFNPMNCVPSMNAYKLFQERLVNNISVSTSYDDNGGVMQQVVYKEYDTTNGNLKKTRTIASNGDTLRAYYSYSSDFMNTSSGGSINLEIKSLLDNNMKTVPVEMISTRKEAGGSEYVTNASLFFYSGNKLKKVMKINDVGILYSAMTKASNDNNGFYYDNRYELESEVFSFDTNGNPAQVNLRSKNQSLIWDGNELIGTVSNTEISNVAATSFESTAKGNWAYTGSTTTHPSAPTGSKGYSLAGGNIIRSALSSGTTYIVSYWKRDSSSTVTVNSGIGTDVITKNGWKLITHEITGTTSVTVAGTAYIDELRLYPKGSLMITYTYTPLIGMTGQCDATNWILYYEYDNFGRLKLIRDLDKNVVKRVEYKYQTCPTSFTNIAQSRNFYKSTCGSGYVSSPVTYTIPAGKYTSCVSQTEVDGWMESEFNLNGQAYANDPANGATCSACTGTYAAASGWTSFYTSITPNSNTVSLTLVVAATSSSSFNNINNGVIIGTITSTCCRPSVARSFSCSESGRMWSVTVYPDGQVLLVRTGGAALPSVYQGFTLSGSYSL
ncbi:MAG: hypothetical protein JNK14_01110 [Chitinophagaceae bacterium]|nr:hypothetical protein [Chitinophagaceae bacterium]